MPVGSITSTNSIYMLVIAGLFPAPQQLQGYAADDIFTNDPISPVTVSMGLDGLLSGGFTPAPKPQAIMLQADSDSIVLFETWETAQEALKDIYIANAVIRLPGIGKVYTCVKGFLTSHSPMPDARRTMAPRRFQITWQSVVGAPM